ncbi:protein floury 1-like [Quercus suber]|uniref:Protein floury 1-like n=1 Tax=Quercus suber TaxID=58331 RepID=A0AAW0KPW8_QUESU
MDCVSCLTFLSQGNGFGCGFFVFGGKSSGFRDGVALKNGAGEESDSKIIPCECESLKWLENSKSQKQVVNSNGDALEENDDDKKECHGEDEECGVMALRKLVKIERQRANGSYAELEKERMAAASAAEEAMAMILRLQREKSSIEIQANQYRRLAERKQQYDQEVIQSLRWIVMKHESNRSLLEDQLRFCRQKLKLCTMKGNEVDHGSEGVDASMRFLNSSTEHGFDDVLISSLDMDSSML